MGSGGGGGGSWVQVGVAQVEGVFSDGGGFRWGVYGFRWGDVVSCGRGVVQAVVFRWGKGVVQVVEGVQMGGGFSGGGGSKWQTLGGLKGSIGANVGGGGGGELNGPFLQFEFRV